MTGDHVTTVHLGEFTWEHANAIAGKLEAAGITWWVKQPGVISQIWEHGVHVFVDRDRLDEAQAIAEAIVRHPEDEGSSSGQT